jgi:adenylate kinase family enzyme
MRARAQLTLLSRCLSGGALRLRCAAALRLRHFSASAAAAAASAAPAPAAPASPAAPATAVLEEARQQVDFIYTRLVARAGGAHNLRWPREIVALTGAPGAGKGTNIAIIKAERDIAESLEVSSLFTTPAFEAMKASGRLISDADVLGAVLEALLRPEFAGGVVLDGFPRTATQAAALVALSERLEAVCTAFARHESAEVRRATRKPRLTLAVLHCDEDESVRRQMSRGVGLAHAAKLLQDVGEHGGAGARATDLNEAKCRLRYSIFKAEVAACLQVVRENGGSGLRHLLIDASGAPAEVARSTRRMFAYAAELDLDAQVYELLRPIPPASSLVQQARSKLVARLAGYVDSAPGVFERAVALVCREVMPKLEHMSLAGGATVRSVNPLLAEHPQAINMVLVVRGRGGREGKG